MKYRCRVRWKEGEESKNIQITTERCPYQQSTRVECIVHISRSQRSSPSQSELFLKVGLGNIELSWFEPAVKHLHGHPTTKRERRASDRNRKGKRGKGVKTSVNKTKDVSYRCEE